MDEQTLSGVEGPDGRAGTASEAAAEPVAVEGSRAAMVVGEMVTVNQASIGEARATELTLNEGGIARAYAGVIHVTDGGIGIAQADSISLSDSGAGVVLAQRADLSQSSVLLLAARQVSGDVRVLFDLRAGAALGLAFGLTLVAFRLLFGRGTRNGG